MQKLNLIKFLIFSQLSFGQNVVVDITDKSDDSIENPVSKIEITEPKGDTVSLLKNKTFTLILEYNGVPNSLHIIDSPRETFADLNDLEDPTDEEYDNLPIEEWQKYVVLVPKHKVLKQMELSNKFIIEIEITSERITHSEIYVDGKLIKTLYYIIE